MGTQDENEPPKRLDERLQAPGLVFVAIGIHWRSRLSDLTMNTALAEEWETDFTSWDITNRTISLSNPTKHKVSLSDGTARFLIESAVGYDTATGQIPRLYEHLRQSNREETPGLIETQYLRPLTGSFPDSVRSLGSQLLNDGFPTSVDFTMTDFAYMMDMDVDGKWFQLNIGVVRAHEIHQRVRARNLVHFPEVATFCNVSHWWSVEEGQAETSMEAVMNQTLDVGRRVIGELEQANE